MRKCILLFFTVCLSISIVKTQDIGLEQDTVSMTKPATGFTFYFPINFYNNSGQDLQMRWVKEEVIENYQSSGHGNTTTWDYSIQDPENFYPIAEAMVLDSSDFLLKSEIGPTDKFIVQVYPNDLEGDVFFKFRIFEIGNPEGSFYAHFDYTADNDATNPLLELSELDIKIYPNPTSDFFQIDNPEKKPIQYFLMGKDGRKIHNYTQSSHSEKEFIHLADLPKGIYFLQIMVDQHVYLKKIQKK